MKPTITPKCVNESRRKKHKNIKYSYNHNFCFKKEKISWNLFAKRAFAGGNSACENAHLHQSIHINVTAFDKKMPFLKKKWNSMANWYNWCAILLIAYSCLPFKIMRTDFFFSAFIYIIIYDMQKAEEHSGLYMKNLLCLLICKRISFS